jgi:plasmid stabilization system protein ParE
MNYSIRYTPQAMRDMDAVWDGVYEASRNFDIADRYVSEFTDEIEAKKLFPFSGSPLQYRGLFTGYYSVNFKKYKAFYRVRDSYIEVARIIMAKRDYMRILFGEPEDESDTL